MVGKFISFIIFPMIAVVLTPKDFGILDLIMTVTSLFGVLISCGLNNAVARYYWDKDVTADQRPLIVSSAFSALAFFSCVISILTLIVWLIAPVFILENGLTISLSLVCSILAITCFSQAIQFSQDVTRLHFSPVKFFTLAVMLRLFGAIAALVFVVALNKGIEGYIYSQALILTFAVPFGLFIIKKDIIRKISFVWIRSLFQFGSPFVFSALAYWLFGSMDRWMMATMSSIEETGIYSIAFRFSTIVLFVSMAFGQAWSPNAIKIQTDNPSTYKRIFANVLLLLMFGMLIFGGGVALFSGEIIHLVMPESYSKAALPLAILCFAVILQSTQQVTAVGISLEKRTYIFAVLAWVAAVTNFIGNYFLIPKFGASGAAFSTLISYFILTSSYLYFTQKLHPLRIAWWRLLSLVLLGSVLAGYSLTSVSDSVDLITILQKFLVALLCLLLGAWLLPWKEIRNAKS